MATTAITSNSPAAASGTTLLRFIELDQPIGRGPLGAVYRAHVKGSASDVPSDIPRTIAVRVLSSRFYSDPAFMNRFYSNANAARRLRHPNILRTFDIAEISGRHCLAMELAEGVSADKWLHQNGKMPEPRLVAVATSVCNALKAALDLERLLHCSLSPANIFIDQAGAFKVGDIGMARVAIDEHGHTLLDTPVSESHFTAPELSLGEKQTDWRSDIYALGATLYYLATGVKPFAEFHGRAALAEQRNGTLADVQKINTSLSDGFCQILEKMLARSIADRYDGYDSILADFDRLSKGGRVTAAALAPGKSVMCRGKAPAPAPEPKKTPAAADQPEKTPAAQVKKSPTDAPEAKNSPAAAPDFQKVSLPKAVAATAAVSAPKAPAAPNAGAAADKADGAPAKVESTAVTSPTAPLAPKKVDHGSWMTPSLVKKAWLMVGVLSLLCLWAWFDRDSRSLRMELDNMRQEIGEMPDKSKKEDYARAFLEQANAYVRTAPMDKRGIMRRYRAVATAYPDTNAGRVAAREADRWKNGR